ncbi:MAG: DNA-processing protein DprA [Limnohabitans sp.]
MASTRESLQAWLRLSLTPRVGNKTARALLQGFGLPEQIFQRSPAELQTLVSPAISQQLCTLPAELEALLDVTWAWLNTPAPVRRASDKPLQTEGAVIGKRLLTLADPDYPQSLLLIPDPPLILYVMGQTQHLHWLSPAPLKAPRAVAIVGSRNPTPQGSLNAQEFAHSLAQAGLTVISGLALGIDTAAHQGALAGGTLANPLHTVAVVGTGLDRVYPQQNHALAQHIAQQGLLLSEYPLNTPPVMANFPKRNRLIAGLSQGCLVVEAALRSGSLITAKQAVEMGKEVFAIPGSIHTTVAKGCHDLIKQGAKLVDSAQDILEEMKDLPLASMAFSPSHPSDIHATALDATPTSPPLANRLAAHLGHAPVGLDELQRRSGLPTSQLQAELFQMELAGTLGRLPGGLYQQLIRQSTRG